MKIDAFILRSRRNGRVQLGYPAFPKSALQRLAGGLIALTALIFHLSAQVPNVDGLTSTPIPGVGHDYIHLLSETVNPANGSLSVRIQIPLPGGRGLSLPFFLSYDSDGLHYLASTGGFGGFPTWYSDGGYLSKGGWS